MNPGPDITVVVFTGGPCGGKSTALPLVRRALEERGCYVVTLPEAATEVIGAGFHPYMGWGDPLGFQEHLFAYIGERRLRYLAMMLAVQTNQPKVLLCDRAELDAVAYVGEERFAEICARNGCAEPDVRDEYDLVVCFQSLAVDQPELYDALKADNPARRETAAEAAEADAKTAAAWLGHPHFVMIDNSTDWAGKVRRALAALARVLRLPKPKEVERKFLVTCVGQFPGLTAVVSIRQDYLVAPEGEERRVREWTLNDLSSYYYTVKRPAGGTGVRFEEERQISVAEYRTLLLNERDHTAATIRKRRTCFVYNGQHLEFDHYSEPAAMHGRWVLERESSEEDRDKPLQLPPGWTVEEVTGMAQYSNRFIARGSMLGKGP